MSTGSARSSSSSARSPGRAAPSTRAARRCRSGRSSPRALGAVCGGILCLGVAVPAGELGEAVWSAESLLALGYLVVAGSLVGFTAYVWLLRAAPVSLVATYAYVNPIVAVVLAWLILGETVTLQMLAAGVAIVVAVALIVRASGAAVEPGRGLLRRRPPAQPSELVPESGR